MNASPQLRCQTCGWVLRSGTTACPFRDTRRPSGTVLLPQGVTPDTVIYLRRGQVVLSSTAVSGAEVSCAVRGPDTLLGLELLLSQPMPYQVWALTDVAYCVLERAQAEAWPGDRAPVWGQHHQQQDHRCRRHLPDDAPARRVRQHSGRTKIATQTATIATTTPANSRPSATDATSTTGMSRTSLDHSGTGKYLREHRTATATSAPTTRAVPINHWSTPAKSPPRHVAMCVPTATSPIPIAATVASIPNRESKVSHGGVDES